MYKIKYSQQACEEIKNQLTAAESSAEDALRRLSAVSTAKRAGGDVKIAAGGYSLSGIAGRQYMDAGNVSDAVIQYSSVLHQYSAKIAALRQALQKVMANFEESESRISSGAERGEAGSGSAAGGVTIESALSPMAQCLMDYDAKTMSGQYQSDVSEAMLEFSDLAYAAFDPDRQEEFDRMLAQLGFTRDQVTMVKEPAAIVCAKMNDDGTPLVIVAFRGSTTKEDWMMNFAFVTTPWSGAHMGFDIKVHQFMGEMDRIHLNGLEGAPSLKSILNGTKKGNNANILLTGHSLGGAEAQLLNYYLLNSGVPSDQVATYTYASPKPFANVSGLGLIHSYHRNWIAYTNSNCYNVVNPNDLVPQVGARGIGGSNAGTNIVIMPDTGFSFDEDIAHDMDTYRRSLHNELYRRRA